jgi:hypothetical protein
LAITVKSRKAYLVNSLFVLGGADSACFELQRTAATATNPNWFMFLLWGLLLVFVAQRRLEYLDMPPWWSLPITTMSLGCLMLLFVPQVAKFWVSQIAFFLPQLPLLLGKTEERPPAELAWGRIHYTVMVVAVVDLPLFYLLRGGARTYAPIFVVAMAYLTSRRFLDVGFPRWWAAPYSLVALSPCAALWVRSDTRFLLILLASTVLQLPAMLLKNGWQPSEEKPQGGPKPKNRDRGD